MSRQHSPADQAEIRLMGLILAQSISIGIAVAIFDAKWWLITDSVLLNGLTYAMGGFAVQGLGYYAFKMFFQQGMDDRMRMTEMERGRQRRYRDMQVQFDRRREDLELRMQEARMETELRWMEENPGRVPPRWESIEQFDVASSDFQPQIPEHRAGTSNPMPLGVNFEDEEQEEKKPAAAAKPKKKEE